MNTTLLLLAILGIRYLFQQKRLSARRDLLWGVRFISETIQGGDSITALRTVEYYSRLALEGRDPELFLILNTVLCGSIRKQLENPDKNTKGNYPFAVEAISKIGEILKEQSLKRKSLN
jgi:hypothetical protein